MHLLSFAAGSNAQGDQSPEIFFIAFTLVAVGVAFVLAWWQSRRSSGNAQESVHDPADWLLRVLTILAAVGLLSFVWISLHLHN